MCKASHDVSVQIGRLEQLYVQLMLRRSEPGVLRALLATIKNLHRAREALYDAECLRSGSIGRTAVQPAAMNGLGCVMDEAQRLMIGSGAVEKTHALLDG